MRCPSTGACLAQAGPPVTTTLGAGATPTFAVLATTNTATPLDAKDNREFDRFTDGGGVSREATSGCGIGLLGGQCLSLGDYVPMTGARRRSDRRRMALMLAALNRAGG